MEKGDGRWTRPAGQAFGHLCPGPARGRYGQHQHRQQGPHRAEGEGIAGKVDVDGPSSGIAEGRQDQEPHYQPRHGRPGSHRPEGQDTLGQQHHAADLGHACAPASEQAQFLPLAAAQYAADQRQKIQDHDDDQGDEHVHRHPGHCQVPLEFVQGQAEAAQQEGAGIYFVQVGLQAFQGLLGGVDRCGGYHRGIDKDVEAEISHGYGKPSTHHLEKVIFGYVGRYDQDFAHRLRAELVGQSHPVFVPRIDGFHYPHDVQDNPLLRGSAEGSDEQPGPNLVSHVVGHPVPDHRLHFDPIRSGFPCGLRPSAPPAGGSARQTRS